MYVTVYSALSRHTVTRTRSPSTSTKSPATSTSLRPSALHPTNTMSEPTGSQRCTQYGTPSVAVSVRTVPSSVT